MTTARQLFLAAALALGAQLTGQVPANAPTAS